MIPSESEQRVLLSCSGLTVNRGSRPIIRELSMELLAGEVVALLGPNGAGKSTLLGCLAGELPAAAGVLERSGRVTVALQSAEMAHRSALQNVELALAWWGVDRRERRGRALAALAALHVEHLAARQASELSGGERRRVHLARTLAVSPEILLLDEPFAGLDGEARTGLLEDSIDFLRAPGRATLVVVHDRTEAWAIADRLLVLLDGRLVAEGPPRDVLEQPPTRDVARFLGYDGELRDGDRLHLTRPAQVEISAAGRLRGRVSRVVAQEDSVRVELTMEHGVIFATCPWPGPTVGAQVGVELRGSAVFPA